MNRFFGIVILLLLTVTSNADERSKAVLDRMSAKVKAMSTYGVDFTASLDGEFNNIKGRFVVNGPKFFVDVYDSEVYSDGKIKQTFSRENNEVIIESVDPDDKTILSNPMQIFNIYDKDFTHTLKGKSNVAGRAVNQIEMTPRTANGVFSNVVLNIDESNNLPVMVSYKLTDIGKTMIIKIDKVTPNIAVTPSTFTFDKSKHQGVEVIDFR